MKIIVVLSEKMSYTGRWAQDRIEKAEKDGESRFKYYCHRSELANDKERIIFVTPATIDKIRGLRIHSFIELGSPYWDEYYKLAVDLLNAQIE
jgi:hypothetical protein